MSYTLATDAAMCIACKACEVHCKVWNRVPVGIKLGTHTHEGPSMRAGKPVLRTRFVSCRHCDDALCIAACPNGAMRRREDGIVHIETRQCQGCQTCRTACPWQMPQYDSQLHTMRKCELCRERLDQGLLPACVTGCTTKALSLQKTQR